MMELKFLIVSLLLLFLSALLTEIGAINIDCEVLFLVRTYSGHLKNKEIFNLRILLNSLKSIQNSNWMALLLNTDKDQLIFDDDVLDTKIGFIPLNASKSYNEWVAGYDMTDLALDYLIEVKAKAKWIIITNGDNYYMPKSLNYINHPRRIDLIAIDFWSRYPIEGSTHPVQMNENNCHKAKLKMGYVDLGGVLISYDRFQKEGRRFLHFGHINAQDGYLFQRLLAEGWKVHYVRKCLFSHSPNPYMCTKFGGIWWNSPKSRSELSNSCMNEEQAALKRSQNSITELVSSTGIIYWEPNEHEKTQNAYLLNRNNAEFSNEFQNRLKILRTNYCNQLKQPNRNFRPELISYALLNHDLQNVFKKDQQYLDHFWAFGCLEMRPIGNAPSDYFEN